MFSGAGCKESGSQFSALPLGMPMSGRLNKGHVAEVCGDNVVLVDEIPGTFRAGHRRGRWTG